MYGDVVTDAKQAFNNIIIWSGGGGFKIMHVSCMERGALAITGKSCRHVTHRSQVQAVETTSCKMQVKDAYFRHFVTQPFPRPYMWESLFA